MLKIYQINLECPTNAYKVYLMTYFMGLCLVQIEKKSQKSQKSSEIFLRTILTSKVN